MIERASLGELPAKHHITLRAGGTADGALRYEHCLTRQGFDGAYSILYHRSLPPRDVGYRLAEILPIPVQARQRLLELEDPISRLEIIQAYLRQHKLLDGD